MKYASLPNFEEKEEDFRAESVLLRRRFSEDGEARTDALLHLTYLDSNLVSFSVSVSQILMDVICSEEDTLVRVSNDKLPGHALALSLQKVWEIIRDQKDLNLPAHKVCASSLQAAPLHAHCCKCCKWHAIYQASMEVLFGSYMVAIQTPEGAPGH